MVVCGLILLCALKGAWLTTGIEVPPDADTIRDIGFIQGLLDGNLLGDPAVAGAFRWYPPLVHGLAALALRLTGAEPMAVWPHAGAVLNLLTPLAFYSMNRALLGPWPATLAVAFMVLFGGSVMTGDEAAGYTPWTLTPALAWPLFFVAIQQMHRHAPDLRFSAAVTIGALLGLAFLAHTVPALLLSGVAVAVVAATTGVSWRGTGWLAIVAFVELLVALPFLGPLLAEYRLHIANPVPGAWVHTLLLAQDGGVRLMLLNLPGLIAAISVLAMTPTAARVNRMQPAAIAVFSIWIALCAAFLARHFACRAWPSGGTACTAFVIAPHHFHVYLQAAWFSLTGYGLWLAYEGAGQSLRTALRRGGIALALVGAIPVLLNPGDRDLRAAALARPDDTLDRAAYRWIIDHTGSDDLFVTLLPAAADQMGSAAATVLAAGRHLAAPPAIHSNPYLTWPPMNARREALLAAVGGRGLCRSGTTAIWFLLPSGTLDAVAYAEPAFTTPGHTLYRRADTPCRSVPVERF